MNDKFYKGINDIKKLALRPSEREAMSNRLLSYIGKEIPKMEQPHTWQRIISWQAFSYRANLSFALLFLILLSGGGLVIASGSSLPGEFLYPLKVNVREPLTGIATVGNVSKISWEAEKIQNRLEETEILAAQGKLDATLREEIQTRLDQDTKSFYDTIQSAEEEVGVVNNAKINLEAKIDAHSRILEKLEDHSDVNQKDEITKFRNNIRGNINSFAKLNLENNTISTSTFEENEKTIESLIKTTEDNLKHGGIGVEASSTLKADILIDTVNDLKEARNALKEAKQKKNSGNLNAAGSALQSSRLKAENASIFLKQGIRLGKEKSDSKSWSKNKKGNKN